MFVAAQQVEDYFVFTLQAQSGRGLPSAAQSATIALPRILSSRIPA
jgi:hypothetical protein